MSLSGFPPLPSKFSGLSNKPPAAQSLRLWLYPAIMAAGGSGRPPGNHVLITLGLLGLFSLDASEKRRANQKPLQLESKPLKKREVGFCRSHAALVSVWERHSRDDV